MASKLLKIDVGHILSSIRNDRPQSCVVHFIGIGGVSMSGLALSLHQKGFIVQGSDVADNQYISHLKKVGIKVMLGHSEENITSDIAMVIKTSTVKDENPEIFACLKLDIPIFKRFELLNYLVSLHEVTIGISGAHGKTTTTALCWKIFESMGIKSSAFVGSVIKDVDSSTIEVDNAKYCVVETDESDGSFSEMYFNHATINNIHNDHLDFYSNKIELLIAHFEEFANKIIAQNGVIIMGVDYEYSRYLYSKIVGYKNLYTISLNPAANKNIKIDFYPSNIRKSQSHDGNPIAIFDIVYEDSVLQTDIIMPLFGLHNIENACFALALFYKVTGIVPRSNVFVGLQGIDKRISCVGQYKNFAIMDDYAHHPQKIAALIKAINDYRIWDSVIYVFEPHKYTRISSIYQDFMSCFSEINSNDYLVVMDIFGVAGGLTTQITKQKFVQDIATANPNVLVRMPLTNDTLVKDIHTLCADIYALSPASKNLIVVFGAGKSSFYAKNLKILLEKLD